ncbi:hypothetical protein KI688_010817 [Linnemannia hyalina]|uniref:Uncharacterized protein n=1 Tax=Linnemannia hyalina TaxID=64524 RepID=A0A9P7XXT2_9FUNG|nr:hypothetical protein KI688_010817 [Linnemannia hyalina]
MAPHFTIAPADPYPSPGGPGSETSPGIYYPSTTASVQADLGISKSLKLDYDTGFQDWSSNPRHTSV